MIYFDRAKDTTTTTGTGNITVSGTPPTGYQALPSTVGVEFPYTIELGAQWESGIATVVSSNVFSRVPSASSSGGALVSFSAGTKNVFCTLTAALIAKLTSTDDVAASIAVQAVTSAASASKLGETLASISKTIHSGAVIATKIYDTGKDSDGGAWRKRCQQTSWYQENINGNWLGQATNELTARGDNLISVPEDLTTGWNQASNGIVTASVVNKGGVLINTLTGSATNIPQYSANVSTTSGLLYAISFDARSADGSTSLNVAMPCTTPITAQAITAVKTRYTVMQAATASGTLGFGFRLANNQVVEISNVKVNQVGALPSTYSGSSELVTNGLFTNGITGWTPTANATVSVANGQATITSNGTDYAQGITGALTGLVIGTTYSLSIAYLGGTASRARYRLNTAGAQGYTNSNTNVVFVATATSDTIAVYADTATVGQTVIVGSISCKQVTVFATPYAPYSSLTGSFYQNTTDGKFYALGATYGTQVETFRGNVREFPEQVAIIAESGRVVIYDLTQVGCPMWMVFSGASKQAYLGTGATYTSVAAVNGQLMTSGSVVSGVSTLNFTKDSSTINYADGVYATPLASLANRNLVQVAIKLSTIPLLVSSAVNDIAVTVLPTAPIDPATGIAVATICCATAGGVSVIKDDGTVVNNTGFSAASIANLCIVNDRLYGSRNASVGHVFGYGPLTAMVTGTSIVEDYTATSIPAVLDGAQFKLLKMPSAIAIGGVQVNPILAILRHNPAAPTKGMIAYITNAYSSGHMVGDVRGAYLSDTVAETVVASGELVTNGTFTDASSWAVLAGAAITGGVLAFDGATSQAIGVDLATSAVFPTVVGKQYSVTYTINGGTTNGVSSLFYTNGSSPVGAINTAAGTYTDTFTALATTAYVTIRTRGSAGTRTGSIDNISVKLAQPDRSVKNTGLIVNGSIVKAAVATGANLMGFSGFSASNYLEQPINPNLDFGTGDFCMALWVKATGTSLSLIERVLPTLAGGFRLTLDSSSKLQLVLYDSSATYDVVSSPATVDVSSWSLVTALRRGGIVELWLNSTLLLSAANTRNITGLTSLLRIGLKIDGAWSLYSGSLALMRISATAPSADQIAKIYRDELSLFQPGAQCTIDGTSTAVTALAYDDNADILHVGTSWGRTAFNGLVRIESAATVVGAITSIAAGQGAHITAGATAGRYYQPAMLLRDELQRKEEARRALGQVPVFTEFDAIAAQTAFALPKGYTTKAVYSAGTLKRVGSTKDYTISFDGFVETVTFAVAPGAGLWVSIMCIRSA